MNKTYLFITLLAICWSTLTLAFDSGSTGADGVLNVTANAELQLPLDGIFNYTDITVAAGATLTFAKNTNNTPVTLLASGDVTINGTIDVSGQRGGAYSNVIPFGGAGGPGGFDGGAGGLEPSTSLARGQDGQGPGAGSGGVISSSGNPRHGNHGVFGNGISGNGNIYGNPELLPLIGGSGGGGAGGYSQYNTRGSGGGGGGGAVLIAASGTVTVNGSILANGEIGGPRAREFFGRTGGSGSGGAIRIVATTLTGEGTISATGAAGRFVNNHGRIRLEAETFNRITSTNPAHTFDRPGRILIPNLPSLRITSVGGMVVPANPTGFRDIFFPGITPNPVTVNFTTTHVPAGTTITLSATPRHADTVTVSSQPTAVDGSATASINLPHGNSLLTAELTIELTASLGRDYSRYAQGEPVQRIRLDVDDKGQSTTTLITESGKEYTIPTIPLAMQ